MPHVIVPDDKVGVAYFNGVIVGRVTPSLLLRISNGRC